MPRRPKLTKELIQEFCKYVNNGLSVKDCCDIVGIAQATFYRWQTEAETGFKEGKKELGLAANLKLKRELSEEIKKAETKFKAFHLNRITTASSEDWKASAWMLERKYPKEYARIDRNAVVLSADNGILPEVLKVLSGLEDEE